MAMRWRPALLAIGCVIIMLVSLSYIWNNFGSNQSIRLLPNPLPKSKFRLPEPEVIIKEESLSTLSTKKIVPSTPQPITERASQIVEVKDNTPINLKLLPGVELLPYKVPSYDMLWSTAQMEDYLYQIKTIDHAVCHNVKRIGRLGDGGWDLCLAKPFYPTKPCYSYSFGVGNIWEFDEQTASQFGCVVRSFDPTMGMADHKHSDGVNFYNMGLSGSDGMLNSWSVMKYGTFLQRFNNFNDIIDILKIDIEFSEWSALEAMIEDGSIRRVKQLLMETHTSEVQSRKTSKDDMLRFIRILLKIEEIGFRRWKHHWNHFGNYHSSHTNKARTCCFEHYYINSLFLREGVNTSNPVPSSSKETIVKKFQHQFTVKAYTPLSLNVQWNAAEAEDVYHNMVQTDHASCPVSRRIGRQDDGGWDVCLTQDIGLDRPCLIYSFGVNYIWEFDDQLSSEYGCEVLTFDPSMNLQTHKRRDRLMFYKEGLSNADTTWSNGWKVSKLSTFLKRFGHEDRLIDILKVDIEHSEWDAFELAIEDGTMSKVKQLLFETHTDEVQGRATPVPNYLRFMRIWQSLYKLGFRQWKHHWNHFGAFTSQHSSKARTCCFEHYLVNTKHLKSSSSSN